MTEIDYDSLSDDIQLLYSTPAHTLEIGDQIIVEDEHVRILSIEETDDIDEIVIKVENYDDALNDTFSLFADDEYVVWSI